MDREKHIFPTRQYPYKKEGAIMPKEKEIKEFSNLNKEFSSMETVENTKVFRFILGIDSFPNPLKKEEVEKLNDTFANLFLKKNIIPLTLNEVLTILNNTNDLSEEDSFLVADG